GIARHGEFADDPFLPLMLWYGVEAAVPENPEAAVTLAEHSRLPLVRKFVARRLTSQLDSKPAGANTLVKLLTTHTDTDFQLDVLQGMSEALRGWRKAPPPEAWAAVAPPLMKSDNEKVREAASELAVVFGDGRALDDLRRVAADKAAQPEARRKAIRVLVESRAEGVVPLLQKLLADAEIAPAAVRGLAAFESSETPKLLLDGYGKQNAPGKTETINTLTSRPAWARMLLERVRDGKVRKDEVPAFQVRQMRQLRDPEVDRLVLAIWPELQHSSKEKAALVAKYQAALSAEVLAKADLSAGRLIYQSSCATCHKLHGEGSAIGPDLTGGDRKNLNYLLDNILDPSAVVPKEFLLSTVTLTNGRVVSGVVVTKTERTLTVQTPTDRLVINADDVDEVRPSEQSLMPDGLLESMSSEQVRDLIGYLMSPTQVPLSGGRQEK
ncbi:MAG TPA: c-type cytochrome, partial [Gemmataceae bacterium]|nr:c-type cytochrome [Gemmataceae bacterium]